ncbi:MAG: hypoxanthine phosphoribosyltransferase [Clostridiales bacterium]|jgi:hypoxanthine phosphoribosyltransferase|nr:hypoxanthine phosphoribosyltransferase [Clostridiales bacterium]OPZ66934.1 MAG: Hypoxanthine-guanine phosphoribosyltransferase [Firmicutes bacterium ADurb.Bin467]
MRNDLAKILLGEEEIQKRVRELGAELARDYVGLEPTLVCILKGAVMFYADLCRAIPIQVNMDFMAVSSYGNRTKSSGEVEIRKDLSRPIDGRHVIIVEDIMDSGFTLSYLSRVLASRGAASVKICTLLDKPERRAPGITVKADYFGFTIGNEFVVGYGLDYAERYRNLPYIGVLRPEIYENN